MCYRSPRLVLALLAVIGLECLQGCRESKEPTYPVSGKVVFKGTDDPAGVGGAIWFERTEEPYDRSAGPINDAGEFTLGTTSPTDGAFAGNFRVRIDAMTLAGTPVAQVSQTVDPKHFSFASSGLTQTVEPSASNVLKIEVERNPKPTAVSKEKRPLGDDGTKVPSSDL